MSEDIRAFFEIQDEASKAALKMLYNGDPADFGYFEGSLFAPRLRIEFRAYSRETDDFVEFLESLSRSWKGWVGEKNWETLEGEISFHCTHDCVGHVLFKIGIRDHYSWTAECPITVDAGSLDDLVQRARRMIVNASR